MPRNLSFMLTTQQFIDDTKDVTRRMGWLFLKVGDVLMAVEKSQGLGKGGKIKRLGLIRIIAVDREPLRRMFDEPKYGKVELVREGFPLMTVKGFIEMFCDSHDKCTPDSVVTRDRVQEGTNRMTVTIRVGNALDELRKMPDNSVHCCVSSPPYWGLRDYGVEPSVWGGDQDCAHRWGDPIRTANANSVPGPNGLGGKNGYGGRNETKWTGPFCIDCGAWRGAFGLEPTPDLFVDHLVEIFEEVRRVLRPDGTLWLNLGDSYATGAGAVGASPGGGEQGAKWAGRPKPGETSMAGEGKRRANRDGTHAGKHTGMTSMGPMIQPNRMPIAGLKPKDLVGVPWMAAFALRRAGWWLRGDNIWHKPNPMPESTTDRCTKAHEYVFLLAKSEQYFYDAVAIAEPASENTNPRRAANYMPSGWATGAERGSSREEEVSGNYRKERKLAEAGSGIKNNSSFDEAMAIMPATRNKRSVWTVATAPFPEAHFATFPPALIEPCILAGTSARGCCVTCMAPWERITARSRSNESGSGRSGNSPAGKGGPNAQHAGTPDDIRNGPVITTETIGWWPSCKCEGLRDLPPHPKKPGRVESDGEDAYKRSLKRWLVECQHVDNERRMICEGQSARATKPAIVLDPFGGAATTGLVADRQQRDAILIELNPVYAEMGRKRVAADAGLFARAAE